MHLTESVCIKMFITTKYERKVTLFILNWAIIITKDLIKWENLCFFFTVIIPYCDLSHTNLIDLLCLLYSYSWSIYRAVKIKWKCHFYQETNHFPSSRNTATKLMNLGILDILRKINLKTFKEHYFVEYVYRNSPVLSLFTR